MVAVVWRGAHAGARRYLAKHVGAYQAQQALRLYAHMDEAGVKLKDVVLWAELVNLAAASREVRGARRCVACTVTSTDRAWFSCVGLRT